MKGLVSKYLSKFFIQQWIIGVSRNSIEQIIKSKTFNPDIKWIEAGPADRLCADPFIYKTAQGDYAILFEDYSYRETYGKIAVMTIEKGLEPVAGKILLDTKSHLSYPFIFSENNKTYVFPEASQSGKLSCYEYDTGGNTLKYLKDIMALPLLDSTIFKYNNRYWLFGTLSGKDADNKLYIYIADNLLGPYSPHSKNPVKTGLNGSRPAGTILEVDGVIYRPSQNSKYTYGESVTINKINLLSENEYEEEFYMLLEIDKKNRNNKGMHGLHTINVAGEIMVVDGTRWRFSLSTKLRQWLMKIKTKFFRG